MRGFWMNFAVRSSLAGGKNNVEILSSVSLRLHGRCSRRMAQWRQHKESISDSFAILWGAAAA